MYSPVIAILPYTLLNLYKCQHLPKPENPVPGGFTRLLLTATLKGLGCGSIIKGYIEGLSS